MDLTYNDVLIEPIFSTVSSREECDPSITVAGLKLGTPIISSNMDTVTDSKIATLMREYGGVGCLHRFNTIEENVKEFLASPKETIVSVGITKNEMDRANALYSAGARYIRIDVAHAATMDTFQMYRWLRAFCPEAKIFVGNFASAVGYVGFHNCCTDLMDVPIFPDALIVGVGGGAACKTRTVAGVGIPMVAALQSFKMITDIPLIADGGINEPGDIAKALAAGASAVMIGKLIAATEESPAKTLYPFNHPKAGSPPYGTVRTIEDATGFNFQYAMEAGYVINQPQKNYRGSASLESYEVQGKVASHRTPEGESFLIPVSGSLKDFMQKMKAGLQSSMSYVGARSLSSFKIYAKLIQISHAGYMEGLPENKR